MPRPTPRPPQDQQQNGNGQPQEALARLQANLLASLEDRTADGTGTNEDNPDWGAVGQTLLRLSDANYEDGIGEMVSGLPNAREISNALAQQTEDEPNSFGLSDMFWVWGQFLDHDITLTGSEGFEFSPILVPAGDSQFDPAGTGEAIIPFTRTEIVDGTGEASPREYSNEITAFIDASMVYGSDEETAASLRDEGGKLLLDEDGLLVSTDDGGVLAGDIRAAENVALTSMHTVFAREHNFWVDWLSQQNPGLNDDELFEAARVAVEAEIQAITFNEFLPLLLGDDVITDYEGYDPSVDPGISVEFATAAFRFGHSLLSSSIQRLNGRGDTIDAGDLSLSEAFFNPDEIAENGGVDPLLRGLADGTAQELDTHVVEDVRSFLFGEPGSGGLDLAALNIERGRDLGVSSYNDLREAVGLSRAESFADITSDAELAAELESVYGDVDLVDAWIGGLAEDAHGDGVIGELFGTIILDQFLRLRDGDAHWSEGLDIPQAQIDALWSTSLADIIERNTEIRSIQDDVMLSYDRIGGTGRADELAGGGGRDLLLGRGGNDGLDGAGGDDQLEGHGGNDSLTGGAGDDQLAGGRGGDTFVFADEFGADTIVDFGRGQGSQNDVLQFNVSGIDSADDVLAAATGAEGGVLIDFGGGSSVLLLGYGLDRLNEDDILIA